MSPLWQGRTSAASQQRQDQVGIAEDWQEKDQASSGESQARSSRVGLRQSNSAASRRTSNTPLITIEMKVDDCLINMEVNAGVFISLMSDSTFQGLWPGRSHSSTQVRLWAYSREPIPVLGCCYVSVSYQEQTGQFQLFVVEGTRPTLMGRDWLTQIQLDWRSIHPVRSPGLWTVLARYPTVFREELGTLKGFKGKIYVDPDA